MRDIRTITLNLDDTLWAIHPVIERAEQALYERLDDEYPRITAVFTPEVIVALREEVIAEFWERNHDFTFLRCTVLARLAYSAGYSVSLVDDAMVVFSAHRDDVEVFPDHLQRPDGIVRDVGELLTLPGLVD